MHRSRSRALLLFPHPSQHFRSIQRHSFFFSSLFYALIIHSFYIFFLFLCVCSYSCMTLDLLFLLNPNITFFFFSSDLFLFFSSTTIYVISVTLSFKLNRRYIGILSNFILFFRGFEYSLFPQKKAFKFCSFFFF